MVNSLTSHGSKYLTMACKVVHSVRSVGQLLSLKQCETFVAWPFHIASCNQQNISPLSLLSNSNQLYHYQYYSAKHVFQYNQASHTIHWTSQSFNSDHGCRYPNRGPEVDGLRARATAPRRAAKTTPPLPGITGGWRMPCYIHSQSSLVDG